VKEWKWNFEIPQNILPENCRLSITEEFELERSIVSPLSESVSEQRFTSGKECILLLYFTNRQIIGRTNIQKNILKWLFCLSTTHHLGGKRSINIQIENDPGRESSSKCAFLSPLLKAKSVGNSKEWKQKNLWNVCSWNVRENTEFELHNLPLSVGRLGDDFENDYVSYVVSKAWNICMFFIITISTVVKGLKPQSFSHCRERKWHFFRLTDNDQQCGVLVMFCRYDVLDTSPHRLSHLLVMFVWLCLINGHFWDDDHCLWRRNTHIASSSVDWYLLSSFLTTNLTAVEKENRTSLKNTLHNLPFRTAKWIW